MPGRKNSDLTRLSATSPATKYDELVATLEGQLQSEIEDRKEERFIWIFALTILADVIILPIISWATVFIFILQVVFLIAVARWLGVDSVVVILERIANRYGTKRDED